MRLASRSVTSSLPAVVAALPSWRDRVAVTLHLALLAFGGAFWVMVARDYSSFNAVLFLSALSMLLLAGASSLLVRLTRDVVRGDRSERHGSPLPEQYAAVLLEAAELNRGTLTLGDAVRALRAQGEQPSLHAIEQALELLQARGYAAREWDERSDRLRWVFWQDPDRTLS